MGKKQKGLVGKRKQEISDGLAINGEGSSFTEKISAGFNDLEDGSSVSHHTRLQTGSKQGVQHSAASIPESPSVSQTLGDNDTDSEGSTGKNQSVNEATKGTDVAAQGEGKAPWVSLFSDNRKPDDCLKLPAIEKVPDKLIFSYGDVEDVEMAWGYCLIGYFAGRFPGKKALLNLCDSWKVNYKYYTHSSGWLVFKFENESSRDYVINSGPYFVFGRPLLLKIMPQFFRFDDVEISSLPVWVMLPGLPLELWGNKPLGMIASKIGKPISTDNLTYTKGRLSYARVLIEVDAAKELVRSVEFQLPNGEEIEQKVVFEFEPKYCTCCRVFGHKLDGCSALDKGLGILKDTKVPAANPEVAATGARAEVIAAATDIQAAVSTGQITIEENIIQSMDVNISSKEGAESSGSKLKQGLETVTEVPFVLVDRNRKKNVKQKGKLQATVAQPSCTSKGSLGQGGTHKAAETLTRGKDKALKYGSTSTSLDKSKGSSLLLSP